jgi:hypothetical protein
MKNYKTIMNPFLEALEVESHVALLALQDALHVLLPILRTLLAVLPPVLPVLVQVSRNDPVAGAIVPGLGADRRGVPLPV